MRTQASLRSMDKATVCVWTASQYLHISVMRLASAIGGSSNLQRLCWWQHVATMPDACSTWRPSRRSF